MGVFVNYERPVEANYNTRFSCEFELSRDATAYRIKKDRSYRLILSVGIWLIP